MKEHPFIKRLRETDPIERSGRVTSIFPTSIQADGPCVPLGTLCRVETRQSMNGHASGSIMAEVIRVDQQFVTLAPFSDRATTFAGAHVTACVDALAVPVGDSFMGRAVDAFGRPIDGRPLHTNHRWSMHGSSTAPLSRKSPKHILETGIRAIDGMLTLGRGQRVGVFAASGVGKTTLMNQLIRQIEADCCVICLVGERGREVEALWSEGLPDAVKEKTTLVAATSDESAAMRVRAGAYALTLADYWRQQGRNVVLFLDSVTRLAMAMREIGLAAGEPPTVRAYTPSVFSSIPKLVERCGALKSGGSISAIMTVLCETDDTDDPIAEIMKSLLDGHIILSRSLAERGHYPAIDVPKSISRQATGLVDPKHRPHAVKACEMLSLYDESRTLIESGIYTKGGNPEIDKVLDKRPALIKFLTQAPDLQSPYSETHRLLSQVVGG